MTETHRPARHDRADEMIIMVVGALEAEGNCRIAAVAEAMWLADSEAVARTGRSISGLDYRRMPEGVSPADMADRLTRLTREREVTTDQDRTLTGVISRIRAQRAADTTMFDESEKSCIADAVGQMRRARNSQQLDRRIRASALYGPVSWADPDGAGEQIAEVAGPWRRAAGPAVAATAA